MDERNDQNRNTLQTMKLQIKIIHYIKRPKVVWSDQRL